MKMKELTAIYECPSCGVENSEKKLIEIKEVKGSISLPTIDRCKCGRRVLKLKDFSLRDVEVETKEVKE